MKNLIFKGTANKVLSQIQNLRKDYGDKTVKEILEVQNV